MLGLLQRIPRGFARRGEKCGALHRFGFTKIGERHILRIPNWLKIPTVCAIVGVSCFSEASAQHSIDYGEVGYWSINGVLGDDDTYVCFIESKYEGGDELRVAFGNLSDAGPILAFSVSHFPATKKNGLWFDGKRFPIASFSSDDDEVSYQVINNGMSDDESRWSAAQFFKKFAGSNSIATTGGSYTLTGTRKLLNSHQFSACFENAFSNIVLYRLGLGSWKVQKPTPVKKPSQKKKPRVVSGKSLPLGFTTGSDGGLRFSGSIGNTFATDLISAMGHASNKTLTIGTSAGGKVHAAMEAGYWLRKNGIQTVLESRCASSCGLVFAGGINRTMHYAASIGIHRSTWGDYDSEINAQEVLDSTGDMVAYYELMGIDPSIMSLQLKTPPDQIHWLNVNDAKAYGYVR